MNLEQLKRKIEQIEKRMERRLNGEDDAFNPDVVIGIYGGRTQEIDSIYFDEDDGIIIH